MSTVAAAAGGQARHQAAAAASAEAVVPRPPPGPTLAAPEAQALTHLRQLSEEQVAAVTTPLGTVRVVAGPGSGKTRVLTARIAHLIRAHGVQPWQVLAITFTNKAANEMKERLAAMLGAQASEELFAGTFHSLCYRILKRHIKDLEGAGRDAAFTIYDQDMSARLLARLVRTANPDWKGKDVNKKADEVQGAISSAKNSMHTWHAATPRAAAEAVTAHLAKQLGAQPSAGELAQLRELGDWFERYEAALRQNNALDFDDLLGLAVALLRRNDSVRQRYLRRFQHVLVDEFQDTNTAQYELVKLLTLPRADLFVVGDPDQAIYAFRGADMTNMTRAFAKDFPAAQVYDLRDNYRSCARIVATAERVIAANDDWQRAGLRPMRPAGNPIEVHVLEDSHHEADFIAREIKGMLSSGEHPAEQIAVLLRTHIQARLVEQQLVLRSIPYIIVGGVPFWRRMEIQDVMAYLRLAVSLRDDVALARIINTPKRAFGDTSVRKLQAHAASQHVSLSALLFGGASTSAAAAAGSGGPASSSSSGSSGSLSELPPLPDRKELGLTPQAAAALEAFRELLVGLHQAVATLPLDRALEAVIAKTGYEQHVKDGGCSSAKKGEQKPGEVQERLTRLSQLVALAAEYEPGQLSGAAAMDVAYGAGSEGEQDGAAAAAGGAGGQQSLLERAQNFLDEAALYSGSDEGGQTARGVRLMTMHAAKGLEFEAVFVPGCNDGLIPLMRAGDSRSDPLAALYEERRLFYVSLTRAKQRLRLTHTRQTTHFGRRAGSDGEENAPSRFLSDVLKAGHAVLREAEVPWQDQGRSRQQGSSWRSRQGDSSSSRSTSSSRSSRSSSGSSSGGGWRQGSRHASWEAPGATRQTSSSAASSSAGWPQMPEARPPSASPGGSGGSSSGNGASSSSSSSANGSSASSQQLSAAQQAARKRAGRR